MKVEEITVNQISVAEISDEKKSNRKQMAEESPAIRRSRERAIQRLEAADSAFDLNLRKLEEIKFRFNQKFDNNQHPAELSAQTQKIKDLVFSHLDLE